MSENRVIVNIDSKKKPINPMIYSNFIEHIGEYIHNGMWAYDPVNVPLVDNIPSLVGIRGDGIRKDVLQKVRDILKDT